MYFAIPTQHFKFGLKYKGFSDGCLDTNIDQFDLCHIALSYDAYDKSQFGRSWLLKKKSS